MNDADLLKLDRALTPAERRALFKTPARQNAGYAATPGSGPAGETCRTCKHLHRKRLAGTYLKCGLMSAVWTGGAATDVKAGSPACSRWEAIGDQ
jgi:hypothetical protein